MSGPAARNGGRVGLAALAAILLLGLALRLDSAWEGRAPVYDATAYREIARNFDEGDGFTVGASATQPSSNYSPGLPLLVAGLYRLSGGEHERFARVVLALLGALAILFTYLIARRLSGPFAGLVGAGAVAVYPALLEYQGMYMGEPLAATLLSGATAAALWAAGPADQARVRWLLPGVLFGALTLVRPEYLGIVALVCLAVVWRRRGKWQLGITDAAILLAGVVLVVAPWTVRNAVALDRFVPVSTGGGQVLFAGTYLPSDGDPEKVGAEVIERNPALFEPEDAERLRLEQILARLAAQRYPDLPGDEALGRMGRDQLWDDISREPVEYAGFVASKVWRVWGHGPREVMRKPGWELFHLALVALAILGFAAIAFRWEALLLVTVLLSITAISALLVASPRRALVALPLVAALAGVGVSWARCRLLGSYNHQKLDSGTDSLAR